MRLREVEEAEKKQMMKERQQKLLEGQLVRMMCKKTTHTPPEGIAPSVERHGTPRETKYHP